MPPNDPNMNETLNELRKLVASHVSDKQAEAQLSSLFNALDAQVAESAKRASDHAQERAQARIAQAFYARAARERLIAPEDAFTLIAADTLKLDDSGKVLGLDEVFEDLRHTRPYFFATTATPGLSQAESPARDPAAELFERARSSGMTRDIQLWRESRRR